MSKSFAAGANNSTHLSSAPVLPGPRDRAAPACAVFAGATILRYAAFAASWSVIGTAIFGGGGAGLTTWALLLAATIPLAALAEAAEGRTAIALGAQLRRRTLRGALALDPSWVRREGPGRIIGRAMEVDAIARLAAGGGLGAVTLAIELGVAAVALAATAPGRAAAIPLAAVLVAAGVNVGARGQAPARLDARAAVADRRAARGDRGPAHAPRAGRRRRRGRAPGGWTTTPASARAPTGRSRCSPARCRGVALAGGLAGIALAGDLDRPGDIALALGGVLLASQALRRLAVAVETLTSAALARQRARADPAGRAGHRRRRRHDGAHAGPPRRARRRRPARARPVRAARASAASCATSTSSSQAGDRAVLAGASGAGKSTLATALAGILPASRTDTSASTARVAGRPRLARPRRPRPPARRQPRPARAGRLQPAHGPRLAGQRATTSPRRPRSAPSSGSVRSWQRMPAGLGQTVGETGWRLSQGERARLCLARALLADHDVLILDEPLGALDPQTARTVLAVARRRARTLVVISQE